MPSQAQPLSTLPVYPGVERTRYGRAKGTGTSGTEGTQTDIEGGEYFRQARIELDQKRRMIQNEKSILIREAQKSMSGATQKGKDAMMEDYTNRMGALESRSRDLQIQYQLEDQEAKTFRSDVDVIQKTSGMSLDQIYYSPTTGQVRFKKDGNAMSIGEVVEQEEDRSMYEKDESGNYREKTNYAGRIQGYQVDAFYVEVSDYIEKAGGIDNVGVGSGGIGGVKGYIESTDAKSQELMAKNIYSALGSEAKKSIGNEYYKLQNNIIEYEKFDKEGKSKKVVKQVKDISISDFAALKASAIATGRANYKLQAIKGVGGTTVNVDLGDKDFYPSNYWQSVVEGDPDLPFQPIAVANKYLITDYSKKEQTDKLDLTDKEAQGIQDKYGVIISTKRQDLEDMIKKQMGPKMFNKLTSDQLRQKRKALAKKMALEEELKSRIIEKSPTGFFQSVWDYITLQTDNEKGKIDKEKMLKGYSEGLSRYFPKYQKQLVSILTKLDVSQEDFASSGLNNLMDGQYINVGGVNQKANKNDFGDIAFTNGSQYITVFNFNGKRMPGMIGEFVVAEDNKDAMKNMKFMDGSYNEDIKKYIEKEISLADVIEDEDLMKKYGVRKIKKYSRMVTGGNFYEQFAPLDDKYEGKVVYKIRGLRSFKEAYTLAQFSKYGKESESWTRAMEIRKEEAERNRIHINKE